MTASTTTIWRPGWPSPSGRRRATAIATAAALAWSLLLVVTAPSLAAPGTRVNVDPEQAQVVVDSTVVLVATVRDAGGNPSVGPDTNTHVRWFFMAGSANDPGGPGNSPDFQCWTGDIGTCSVSYVAVHPGSDTVCALVGGSQPMCDAATTAPEWDDHSDSVERVVTNGPGPTPVPTPDPTPVPTPDPTPDPTPVPTPDPTPVPTPDPTPVPTPDPTPDPTPVPTPDPTPVPTPDPTPVPTPVPTPDPSPVPTPDPTPMPAAAAPPAPTHPMPPAPQPDTAPDPMPEPGTSDPAPDPAQGPAERIVPAPPIDVEPTMGQPMARPHPGSVEPVAETDEAPDPALAGAGFGTPPLLAQAPTPTGIVAHVLAAAITGVTTVVQPAAAVAVAQEFTFPITLTVAVLLYVAIQGHIDRRDPKLRLAPQHVVETVVRFESEDEL